MKKMRARILALMLAVSMVVPNGVGANTMATVQAEEIGETTVLLGYTDIESEEGMTAVLQKNVTATTENDPQGSQDGLAVWAFDDEDHWWHSNWRKSAEVIDANTGRVWIQTSFDKAINVGKIEWTGRANANNGSLTRIRNYEIWVANTNNKEPNDDEWVKVAERKDNTGGYEQESVEFPYREITHIRLKPWSSSGTSDGTVAVKRIKIYSPILQTNSATRNRLGAKIAEVEATGHILTTEAATVLANAKEAYANYDASITDEVLQGYINELSGKIYTDFRIDKATLKAHAESNNEQSPASENDGPAEYAFNDSMSDWWHTMWTPNQNPIAEGKPAWLETGFGESVWVSRIAWTPRSQGNSVQQYEIWVANLADASVTPTDADYVKVKEETFANKSGETRVVVLDEAVKATHIRLKVIKTGSNDGYGHVCISEMDVWKKDVREALSDRISFVESLDNNALTTALATAKAVYETTADDATYAAALSELDAARTATATVVIDEELTLTREDVQTLTATVTSDALFSWEKLVKWSTSDADVATVDANGKVTAVAAGEATITATLRDNVNVTASCTVTVVPKKFAVTTGSANEEQGTVEVIDATYNEGTEITAKATAKEGFVFTNWTDANGTVVSTEATYSFVVTETTALTAHFETDNQLKLEAFSINGNNNVTLDKDCHWSIENYTGIVSSTATRVTATANSNSATITVSVNGEVKATGTGSINETIYLPAVMGSLTPENCTVTLTVTEGEETKTYTFELSAVKFLSDNDMEWLEGSVHGWRTAVRDGNVQENTTGSGLSLKVANGQADKVFTRGLGVHATSVLIYDISDFKYDKFEAYVGVEGHQRNSSASSITYRVYKGDGTTYTKVYDSGEMYSGDIMKHVVITGLSDATRLKLEVDKGTSDGSDHGAWADAKLTNGFVASAESITLDQESITVEKGSTATLTATVTPNDVTEYTNKLTWTSSNEEVATVKNGVVTPVAAGTTTITVTTEDGKSASCTVTVPVVNATAITLNKEKLVLEYKEGAAQQTQTLVATVEPHNTTSTTVTWTSLNPSVATVDANGVVTPVAMGETTVTATVTNPDGSICEAECNVYVARNVALDANQEVDGQYPYVAARYTETGESNGESSIMKKAVDGEKRNGDYAGFGDGNRRSTYFELNLGEMNLIRTIKLYRIVGRSYPGTVIAVSKRADFSNPIVVYNSNTTEKHGFGVGTDVASSETTEGLVVELEQPVEARYIRVYMDGSNANEWNHIDELEVLGTDLNETDVDTITLDKTALTLGEGAEVELTATATPEDAVDKKLTWISDNTEVATVDANGKVTAVKAGTANITVMAADGLVTATCAVTVEANKIVVTACTVEGDVITKLDAPVLAGGGTYDYKDTAKLTASVTKGYTFLGWYKATMEGDTVTAVGNRVSGKASYSVEVDGTDCYVAVYEAVGKATVTVDGTATKYNLGEEVTVTAAEENFAGWQNAYGVFVTRDAKYTFTVTGNVTLTAVYNTVAEDKVLVVFESVYGQELAREELTAETAATYVYPEAPARYGYTVKGWSVASTDLAGVVAEELKTTDKVLTIVPVYAAEETKYAVSVTGGTLEGGKTEYQLSEVVKVKADAAEEGKQFSHWVDAEGNILSYNENYTFYLVKAVALTAVYADAEETVAKAGVTEILTVNDTATKVSFVSLSTVPEGYTIHKAGVIAELKSKLGTKELTDKTATYIAADAWSGTTYRYTLEVNKGNVADSICVRAYLVYEDTEGHVYTVYGDVKENSLLKAEQ